MGKYYKTYEIPYRDNNYDKREIHAQVRNGISQSELTIEAIKCYGENWGKNK